MNKFAIISAVLIFILCLLESALGQTATNIAGAALTTSQCFGVATGGALLATATTTSGTTEAPRLAASMQPLPVFNTKYTDYLNQVKPNNKPKDSAQFSYREQVYMKNLKKINDHNMNTKKTYHQGLNQFADLEQTEFLAIYAKYILPNSTAVRGKNIVTIPSPTPPIVLPKQLRTETGLNSTTATNGITTPTTTMTNPTMTTTNVTSSPTLSSNGGVNRNGNGGNSVPVGSPALGLVNAKSNLYNTNVVTVPPSIIIDWSCKASAVITQGQCGSCYIIAPLESVLITTKIYNKSITPLSIQQVLSCGLPSTPTLNGCVGGSFDSVYEYLKNNGTGRALMYGYDPMAIAQGVVAPCNTGIVDSSTYKSLKVKVQGYEYVPAGDCAALIEALKFRAISVAIVADGLQFYQTGTFNGASTVPNHGVTLVGYDPAQGYKIKNSWGPTWGNAGYGYLSETTGICDNAMYPVLGIENQPMGPCCA